MPDTAQKLGGLPIGGNLGTTDRREGHLAPTQSLKPQKHGVLPHTPQGGIAPCRECEGSAFTDFSNSFLGANTESRVD